MSALEWLRQNGPARAAESSALGEWLLGRAGFEPREGLVSAGEDYGHGTLYRVASARAAEWIAVVDGERVRVLARQHVSIQEGVNLADEPRDTVILADVAGELGDPVPREEFRLRGALVRAVLMAGALDAVSSLSLTYAQERVQFGRPIASFQAVQAHLVNIAQQAALVGVAVDAAASTEAPFEIAAAKLLANRAAITAARAAHQVHGARGTTLEHPLSLHTRRLWAWRNEFGGEREWSNRLGVAAAAAGADRLYPAITGGSSELEV